VFLGWEKREIAVGLPLHCFLALRSVKGTFKDKQTGLKKLLLTFPNPF
jgi:hypothetical protein